MEPTEPTEKSPMTPEERELIQNAKAEMATAKASIRAMIRILSNLMPIVERDAGKPEAAQVQALRAEVYKAFGFLDAGHAAAGMALLDKFSDAGEIVVFGPIR